MKTRATKNILSAQKAKRIAKAKASFLTALMTVIAMLGSAMTAYPKKLTVTHQSCHGKK